MSTISGIDEVMKNLNKVVESIQGDITVGLIKTSIIIRRDMENTSPKIPIDLGNLRASWFTVISKGEGGTKGGGFRGEDAGTLTNDHSQTVGECEGLAKIPGKSLLIMGFSANYALLVHENVDAQFFGRKGKHPGRPGSGAKFFEAALKRNQNKIISILAKEVQIP